MIVLWCGPVSASNLAGVAWRGSAPRIVTVNHGADGAIGSDAFGRLGAQLRAANGGSVLRGLVPDGGPVVVAGFSAGFGLMESILSCDDLERVAAIGAFDAYYTNATKARKPGYAAFAQLAADGRRRMVMTSSYVGGPTYPSSANSTRVLLEPLELSPIDPVNVPPAECERAEGRGELRWFTYRDRSTPTASHVQHATILAPHFMPELVSAGEQLPAFAALLALAAWGLS